MRHSYTLFQPTVKFSERNSKLKAVKQACQLGTRNCLAKPARR